MNHWEVPKEIKNNENRCRLDTGRYTRVGQKMSPPSICTIYLPEKEVVFWMKIYVESGAQFLPDIQSTYAKARNEFYEGKRSLLKRNMN